MNELNEEINAAAIMDEPVEKTSALKIETKPLKETPNITVAYLLTQKQKKYLVFKRTADFLTALVSLIILAVPFLIIAVIQKISAPKEPVFFTQTRIGRGGEQFKLTKFRSMKSSAPAYCSTSNFVNDGEYITPFCRFLRNTSIDELPQLFQVLTGKMSLIGPRPLIPQEEDVHKMREKAGVYQLKPGITGWAQINGRDLVEDVEKVRLDKEYLEKVGIKLDTRILFGTFFKVLKKSDIVEERQTALLVRTDNSTPKNS